MRGRGGSPWRPTRLSGDKERERESLSSPALLLPDTCLMLSWHFQLCRGAQVSSRIAEEVGKEREEGRGGGGKRRASQEADGDVGQSR